MSRLQVITCHFLPLHYRFKSAFKYIIPVKLHNNPVSLGNPNTFLLISYPNEIFPGKS